MIEIKNTIQEVLDQEAKAEEIVTSAQIFANNLKQSTDHEIEVETKLIIEEGKQEAKKLLDNARLSAERQAQEIIEQGKKQAESLKQSAEKNVSEVSDYIIHKLKVNYGNR